MLHPDDDRTFREWSHDHDEELRTNSMVQHFSLRSQRCSVFSDALLHKCVVSPPSNLKSRSIRDARFLYRGSCCSCPAILLDLSSRRAVFRAAVAIPSHPRRKKDIPSYPRRLGVQLGRYRLFPHELYRSILILKRLLSPTR